MELTSENPQNPEFRSLNHARNSLELMHSLIFECSKKPACKRTLTADVKRGLLFKHEEGKVLLKKNSSQLFGFQNLGEQAMKKLSLSDNETPVKEQTKVNVFVFCIH